ncbi:MAG: hypothetical protein ABEJ64_02630 [Candidatus Nanohaloarchaea archaeon]
MAFDLPDDEVDELRQKYAGSHPDPEILFSTAEDVQQLIEGQSGIIGGLTTYEGVQSTKTRRPISASVDVVVDDADIQALGQDFRSWKFGPAYFADVNDIEVGVLKVDEFPAFDFPDSALEQSYMQEVLGNELVFAEPESNMASKFNRVSTSRDEDVKGSDALDMNSHLHWAAYNDRDIGYLAEIIYSSVDGDYQGRLERMRQEDTNFDSEEWKIVEEAQEELERHLT